MRAARDELVAALEAAGLRVAVRSSDITPPVVYVAPGVGSTAGSVPLAGALQPTWYAHWIPIRGVDNPDADCDAIDAVVWAVSPFAVADVTWAPTSVTLNNVTWPCVRFDVPVLALHPAEVP